MSGSKHQEKSNSVAKKWKCNNNMIGGIELAGPFEGNPDFSKILCSLGIGV